MDEIQLRNAALMTPEDSGLAQIRSKVSGVQNASTETAGTVIQNEIGAPLLYQFIGHQSKTSIIICREEIAAPIQRFSATCHLQRSDEKASIIFNSFGTIRSA